MRFTNGEFSEFDGIHSSSHIWLQSKGNERLIIRFLKYFIHFYTTHLSFMLSSTHRTFDYEHVYFLAIVELLQKFAFIYYLNNKVVFIVLLHKE